MVEHGAKLNSEEQKKLVQCLAGRDSTILSLCNVVGVVKSLDTDGGKDITPYICVIRKQRF